MSNFTKQFKENTTNVNFKVTTPENKYFDFCRLYKKRTGESVLLHPNIRKQNKWGYNATITFNSKNKYIQILKNSGYKVTKNGKQFKVNDFNLFWKLIDEGFRIWKWFTVTTVK